MGSFQKGAGKPLEITVVFADVEKSNFTMNTVFIEGIVAVIVADTGEKEMWEMNDICPEVYI